MNFNVGDTFGDYEVVGVLGSGGMGRVYKVRNVLTDRFEAMKVLLPESLGSPEMVERFLREIRVQASLDHPNIAALRTAQRIGDQIVMIMEFVDGESLQTILKRGPISFRAAVDYMSQALAGLDYAHGHGVVHRDIKPANIMLARDGVIKITDFGIARVAADGALTRTGAAMGSIHYMSPEQLRGTAPTDARSDIYALGVTFYEALTGAPPFGGDTDYSIMNAHINDAPPPLESRRPGAPPDLSRAIHKALAKPPTARYQSAREFRDTLQSIPGLPEEAVVAPATAPVSTGAATGTRTASTATRAKATASLEMGYVLFMDIVAYSMLPMDRQTERIQELAEIVRSTEEFQRATINGQLVSLPTGDGMALVFFQNVEASLKCATEVSRALRNNPEIKLRMGIHTGPVYRVSDINTNSNVAGGGINLAQRVMDCGDAGHILVSKTVAEMLGQLSDWAGSFHDLGEAEVKHGVKVNIVNFYTSDVGNPELPKKLTKPVAVQAAPATPPAVAPQPHAPAAPAPVAVAPALAAAPAAKQGSNKILIAVGGVAAVALIGFAAMQFSHRSEGGAERTPAVQTPSQPSIPVPPPPGGTTAAPPPSGSPPPPSAAPAAAVVPQSATAPSSKPVAGAPSTQLTKPAPAAAAQAVAAQAPPAAPGSSPASATAAAAPAAADRAAMQEQRERMIQLVGRQAALRGSLDNLERQQKAAGLGLRGDMAAARESLDYLIGESKSSMAAGDTAATKRNLDLAEQQVEKLEKFLGR